MEVELAKKNAYEIIRISTDLRFETNIIEIKKIVKERLKKGYTAIAISLTKNSHLSSMSIGTILQCHDMIRKAGGEFALIHPNNDDQDLLDTLGLSCMMQICKSEDEL